MPHSQGLSILSQINTIPSTDTYFFNVHFLIVSSHLHVGSPMGLFLVGFPVKILLVERNCEVH